MTATSHRRRLGVVSNRGPIGFARDDGGERSVRRGSGGLVSALSGLVRAHDVTWTACALSPEDRVVAEERGGAAVPERTAAGDPFLLRLVAPDPEAYRLAYGTVANPLLWFIHHGLDLDAIGPLPEAALRTAWDGYRAVNDQLADAAAADHATAEGIFVHDYHLDLAPARLRAAGATAPILHFTHIPWPEPEAWEALPDDLRGELLRGILGADIVGLHTARDADAFRRTCTAFLPEVRADGDDLRWTRDGAERRAVVRAYPISISPDEIRSHIDDPAARDAFAALERYADRQIILRVDRTDPSKNIPRGLAAYERLLERRPDLHGTVVFLVLLHPSRQELPVYAELVREIEETTAAINARFGQPDWLPIDLRVGDNFPEVVAAYRRFDVLLVNAIADGMNLVSKEAPLVNERDGVLVLSERAGAVHELGTSALVVDPFDVEQTADRLEQALALPPAERRRRLAAIREQVEQHDVDRWIADQLADLASLDGRSAG